MDVIAKFSPGSLSLAKIMKTYDREIETSLSRLASGLRVSRPSDDTGNYFRAQDLDRRANLVSGLSTDLQDHISRLKTAEDALDTVGSLLDEMAEIAKNASTESVESARVTLGKEFDSLRDQIDNIVNSSRYDGAILMDGSYDTNAGGSAINVQIDEDVNDLFSYIIYDARATEATGLNMTTSDAETEWTDANGGMATASTWYTNISEGDQGIKRNERNISRINTNLVVINGANTSLQNRESNYQAARSALVGVNQAEETARYTSLQIQQQAAASFLAQSNMAYSSIVGTLTGVRMTG